MKTQDKSKFIIALARTRVSLPKSNLTAEEQALRIEVFWEELSDYPIEDVEGALKRARRELKYFPTIAEVIEFISPIELSQDPLDIFDQKNRQAS